MAIIRRDVRRTSARPAAAQRGSFRRSPFGVASVQRSMPRGVSGRGGWTWLDFQSHIRQHVRHAVHDEPMILVVVLISGELGFPSGGSNSNKSSADRPLLSTHLGAFHRRRRRTAARSHHLLSELIIGPHAEGCCTDRGVTTSVTCIHTHADDRIRLSSVARACFDRPTLG